MTEYATIAVASTTAASGFCSLLASRYPRDGLILGRFADPRYRAMRDNELTELERLIELPDPISMLRCSATRRRSEYATRCSTASRSFSRVDHDA